MPRARRAGVPAAGSAHRSRELRPGRWKPPPKAGRLACAGGGAAVGCEGPFAARRGEGGLLRARGGASAVT